MAIQLANVRYQGEKAGVVYWDRSRGGVGVFEYTKTFIEAGVELAPLHMPLRSGVFVFERLHESFSGLPGLLADCLPDTFGHALIDEWLRQQRRDPADFSPVERLCYLGNRGMGALEFEPALREKRSKAERIEVENLVALASKALQRKEGLSVAFEDEEEMNEILRVGTSAGGARAKAVIALNPQTLEVRSGQAAVPRGFEHWLMKFDGVSSSFDGVRDPQGYGRIEYAYHLMALEAGIEMMPCRLLEEGGRAHFMTRRFDRVEGGRKIHFASLFGIAHMTYGAPGVHRHSYEDYFQVIEDLGLAPASRLEAFRRMVFNVLAANKDDHVKNFGFIHSESKNWELSPAYDVTYAYNPMPGKWTAMQQMSVLGKRETITCEDMLELGRLRRVATLPKLRSAMDQVVAALQRWEEFAGTAGVEESQIKGIGKVIRTTTD